MIGGFLFSSWAAKPSYAPLFTNLSPTDASGIIDKLNANKTPYQLAANGTEILVPSKDVYTSRLAMSSAGLPSSTSSSYDLLDKEGITTSEFKQNVDYQRGLEGELANTIKVINGVQNAAVNLAIPQDTVFNDSTSKPTASVLLTLDPGTTLTSNQVKAIVNLVSSSVPGMTADNVSLSDATGKVYSAAGQGTTGAAPDGDQAAATNAYIAQTTSNIQKMLDTLVGPGHSTVKMSGQPQLRQVPHRLQRAGLRQRGSAGVDLAVGRVDGSRCLGQHQRRARVRPHRPRGGRRHWWHHQRRRLLEQDHRAGQQPSATTPRPPTRPRAACGPDRCRWRSTRLSPRNSTRTSSSSWSPPRPESHQAG